MNSAMPTTAPNDCFRWLVVAAVATAVIVIGCSEESPPPAHKIEAARSSKEIRWLEPGSDLTPQQWLLSRREKSVRPLNSPEVLRVRKLLDAAHQLYRESSRIIANRTVQVEEALREKGFEEDAIRILEDLGGIAGEVGQTEGYGALSQHYLNMRTKGLGRGEALAEIKALYGKRP